MTYRLNIDVNDPKWRHFIGGATGGMTAAILTSPLEIIKTRLQTKESRTILSNISNGATHMRNIFSFILRTEGIVGFWRGITPNLIGVVPARALYFGSYSKFKDTLRSQGFEGTVPNFTAASISGCITATLTCPIWVIKTRYQLLPTATAIERKIGLRQLSKEMYKREGIKSFFKGLSASYWGVTEGAIQLALYENIKKLEIIDTSSNIDLLASAAFAKLIAAALTYPHEVVRTRLRDQRTFLSSQSVAHKYRGMIQSIRLILKEEGRAGLYGGMSAHLMKVVPNAAIMYFVVEMISGTG